MPSVSGLPAKLLTGEGKISQKENTMADLALIRSAIENAPGSLDRCYKRDSTNFAIKKRKLSEINEDQKETEDIKTTVKANVDAQGRFNAQNEMDWEMDITRSGLCKSIVLKLMTSSFGWVFHRTIATIKTNIEIMKYKSTSQFAQDMKLIFEKATKSNHPHSDTHVNLKAKSLERMFNSEWQKAVLKWKAEDSYTPVKQPYRKKLKKKVIDINSVNTKQVFTSSVSKFNYVDKSMSISSQKGVEDADNKKYKTIFQQKSSCNVIAKGFEEPFYKKLSPSKAVRVAKLKERFANIIEKSQQELLNNNG